MEIVEPELVIVHGLCGTHRQVALLEEYFKALGMRVKSLTLPGHGKNDRAYEAEISDWVQFVHSQITNPNTILVGHSLGGYIAQLVADTNNNVVEQVLITSYVRGVLLSWRALWCTLCWRYLYAMWSGKAFGLLLRHKRKLFNNGQPDKALEVSYVPESGRILRAVALGQFDWSWHPVRKVRTCIITAGRDAVIRKSAAKKLHRVYGGELHTIPGASHMVLSKKLWAEQAGEIIHRWMTPKSLPSSQLLAAE